MNCDTKKKNHSSNSVKNDQSMFTGVRSGIQKFLFHNYQIAVWLILKDKDGLSGGHIISVCTLRDSLDIVFDNETDMLMWLELLLSCQQVRVMKLTYYPEIMNQDFFFTDTNSRQSKVMKNFLYSRN